MRLGIVLAGIGLHVFKAEDALLGLHDVHVGVFHARIDDGTPIHVVHPRARRGMSRIGNVIGHSRSGTATKAEQNWVGGGRGVDHITITAFQK